LAEGNPPNYPLKILPFIFSCLLQKLNIISAQQKDNNLGRTSPDRLAVPTEVQVRLYAVPPPSPNSPNAKNNTQYPFSESSQSLHENFQQSRKGSDVLLVSNRQYHPRKLSAEISE
jgi:hypothetical protein